jgi:hypothetical protein
MTIETAKHLGKYKNQWVALVNGRVVASGKTLQEVKTKVEQKKIKEYVFHLVPTHRLAFHGH